MRFPTVFRQPLKERRGMGAVRNIAGQGVRGEPESNLCCCVCLFMVCVVIMCVWFDWFNALVLLCVYVSSSVILCVVFVHFAGKGGDGSESRILFGVFVCYCFVCSRALVVLYVCFMSYYHYSCCLCCFIV